MQSLLNFQREMCRLAMRKPRANASRGRDAQTIQCSKLTNTATGLECPRCGGKGGRATNKRCTYGRERREPKRERLLFDFTQNGIERPRGNQTQ